MSYMNLAMAAAANQNAIRRENSDDEDENDPPAPAPEVRRFRRGLRNDAYSREAEGYVPSDGLPWIAAKHPVGVPRLLTSEDPRAPDPPGFRGNLYTPQRTLLAAMLALEQRPFINIGDIRYPEGLDSILQTRMARISEKFSFGKTVLSLALICSQRVPARLPDQQPMMTYPVSNTVSKNRASVSIGPAPGDYDICGTGFIPEVAVRYSRYLPLTIVAAASNVISQWENETKRFTDLRYFIIENVRSLREFEKQYREGLVANLDLIFVKAGRVTTSFVVKGEPKPADDSAKNRSLFEALGKILEGVPVARLIIDDYDTLKLGSDDCFIPALFTWLVSATRRQTSAKASLKWAPNLEQFFRSNIITGFPILGAALDDVINKVFSLHCSPDYVDAHISSTAIDYRRIFVRGGQAAAILRNLDIPEEVVEMVNADAIGTAAQALDIDASSVGDVIRRVVGNHLNKLRHAVRTLSRIADAKNALAGKEGKEKNREIIKDMRAALKDGSDEEVSLALEAVEGPSSEVSAALKSLESWAEEQKEKHGKTLNRMRDNIREGQCQCCMVPFEPEGGEEDAAYVLAGCCQIIVCEACITRKENGLKIFIKRCPNCARDIKIKTGVVRVGTEIDLEAALKDDVVIGDEEIEPCGGTVVDEIADSEQYALDKLNNPKLKALMQLLVTEFRKAKQPTGVFVTDAAAATDADADAATTEQKIDCIQDLRTPPYIEGLLDGRRNIPWPADKPRKILIFTMHFESTTLIASKLEHFKIPFCILRGTRVQKDEAVELLRTSVNVMLVTAPKDCGGLNLPFLSHIVFYHRMLDRNVEAQVAARGQRLGREGNLEIITLINEAEAEK